MTQNKLTAFQETFKESRLLLEKIENDSSFLNQCEALKNAISSTLKNENNIYVCGNGGSHCDAMHFAEELTGRYEKNRRPLGALALGDPSHITCVGNDFGFKDIFSRQLQGLGRKGDFLLVISTSGNSENLIQAVDSAASMGIQSGGLLGKTGGPLLEKVNFPVLVPSNVTSRIQELHIKIIHSLIVSVETDLGI